MWISVWIWRAGLVGMNDLGSSLHASKVLADGARQVLHALEAILSYHCVIATANRRATKFAGDAGGLREVMCPTMATFLMMDGRNEGPLILVTVSAPADLERCDLGTKARSTDQPRGTTPRGNLLRGFPPIAECARASR